MRCSTWFARDGRGHKERGGAAHGPTFFSPHVHSTAPSGACRARAARVEGTHANASHGAGGAGGGPPARLHSCDTCPPHAPRPAPSLRLAHSPTPTLQPATTHQSLAHTACPAALQPAHQQLAVLVQRSLARRQLLARQRRRRCDGHMGAEARPAASPASEGGGVRMTACGGGVARAALRLGPRPPAAKGVDVGLREGREGQRSDAVARCCASAAA